MKKKYLSQTIQKQNWSRLFGLGINKLQYWENTQTGSISSTIFFFILLIFFLFFCYISRADFNFQMKRKKKRGKSKSSRVKFVSNRRYHLVWFHTFISFDNDGKRCMKISISESTWLYRKPSGEEPIQKNTRYQFI